ncbi:MAG TPA: DUF6458 family protein [Solirubrobacteraceae bacterium]|jgi:hypothetical protein|nr:DUF6458 family protein [Solirubrobacteraceae bacterium]
MTLGTSLFLIAAGAILKFAVTWTVAGIDLHVAGVVLMVVGIVGLLVGLALLFSERRPTAVAPPRDPGYRPPPEM